MEESRQLAAQCWCDDANKNKVMDVDLAESAARRIAAWMDTAAQAYRDVEYYRGLLISCGEILGPDSYVSDDGSVQQDVLCAKIPELVQKLVTSLHA